MFLDDKLLKMCEESKIETPEDIQQLNIDICELYDEYYKTRLKKTMNNKETKCILDKTFNLFNSFVRMAKKSENYKLQKLGELFEKFNYKKQFLSNEEINEIYNKL